MPKVISVQEWQELPVSAQREVRDFYLFVRAKYATKKQDVTEKSEAMLLSEEALAKDWINKEEEEAWRGFQ